MTLKKIPLSVVCLWAIVCFAACKKDFHDGAACDIAHSRPVTIIELQNGAFQQITRYTYDAYGRTLTEFDTSLKAQSTITYLYNSDTVNTYTIISPPDSQGISEYIRATCLFNNMGYETNATLLEGSSYTIINDYSYDGAGQLVSRVVNSYYSPNTIYSKDSATYEWTGENLTRLSDYSASGATVQNWEYTAKASGAMALNTPMPPAYWLYNPIARFAFNKNFPLKVTTTDANGAVLNYTLFFPEYDANGRLDHYLTKYYVPGSAPVVTTYGYKYECL